MPHVQAVADEPSRPAAAPGAEPVLRLTLYDRISALMMALAISAACLVLVALGYWWATRRPTAPEVVALEIVDVEGGGDLDGAPDETLLVESPEEPSPEAAAENVAEEVDVQQQLEMVTQVSTQAALQSFTEFESGAESQGQPGSAVGTGRRPLGEGPGSGGGVARELRWFVTFASESSLAAYTQQLDFFGIELGALLRDGRLVYLANVSTTNSARTVNSGKDEPRLYFKWQGGERRQADLQLFRRVGVDASRGVILHFYPEKTENLLATLEYNYAKRPAKEIRRTYFSVKPQPGGGYTFEVTRQTYLR